MYKVGIVGLGMAGIRFVRCLEYLHKTKQQYELVGVYDLDANSYHLLPDTVNKFDSLEDFAAYNKYDVVIISVNERNHFSVLKIIKPLLSNCKKYIIEKPLCTSISEYESILDLCSNDEVILHYVERYSDAISNLKAWIEENNCRVLRIGFTWGKLRLYDPRPTIGIVSELVHPLDLCNYIIGCPDIQLLNVDSQIISSNYSISGDSVPDTINLLLQLDNGIIITGTSSFLFDSRQRNLTIYASDKNEQKYTYLINLYFDNPRWDIDGYDIYKISIDGNRKLIKSYKTDNNANVDTLCITKSLSFLLLVYGEIETNTINTELHHLKDSYFLQKVEQQVLSSSKIISTNPFSGVIDISSHNKNIETYVDSWRKNTQREFLDTGY